MYGGMAQPPVSEASKINTKTGKKRTMIEMNLCNFVTAFSVIISKD
jgi:hypothetical protein